MTSSDDDRPIARFLFGPDGYRSVAARIVGFETGLASDVIVDLTALIVILLALAIYLL